MSSEVFISEPLPEVLTINLNWNESDAKPSDILKLLAAVPDKFRIDELFSLQGG